VDEKPAADAGLFSELPPNGLRQFEIVAELPGSPRPPMSAIAPAAGVPALFLQMFAACERVPDFELKIRPLGSGVAAT
jgi:hypothetical protein